MSHVVVDLTQRIKDQKLKLKEPIKDLKYVLRPQYKALGDDYKEKKTAYEHEKHNEEKDIQALRNSVKDLEEECARDETRWHQKNVKMQIEQVMDMRLKPVEPPVVEPLTGEPCKSYRALYTVRKRAIDEETEKVRKLQKDVRHKYEPQKEQMAMLA